MFRKSMIPLLLTILINQYAIPVSFADGHSNMEIIEEFFHEKLSGKTFTSPVREFFLDNGRALSIASSRVSFSALVYEAEGSDVSFTTHWSYKQTIYHHLDANGRPLDHGVNKDRTFVLTYQLSERKSTGEVLGLIYPATGYGTARSVRASLDNSQLQFLEETILYEDLFAANDAWRPGATRMVRTFVVTDGDQVIMTEKLDGYDVDPVTLQRTHSDNLPLNTFTIAE